jgi:hypothetical protein
MVAPIPVDTLVGLGFQPNDQVVGRQGLPCKDHAGSRGQQSERREIIEHIVGE